MRPTFAPLLPLILLAGCVAATPAPAPAGPAPASCRADLATSRQHCGACGHACEEGEVCLEGGCHEDPQRAVQIAMASGYACALRADGAVWCWGAVPWRPSSPEPRLEPELGGATQVAVLASNACVLLGSGSSVCLGASASAGGKDRQNLPFQGGASVISANGENVLCDCSARGRCRAGATGNLEARTCSRSTLPPSSAPPAPLSR